MVLVTQKSFQKGGGELAHYKECLERFQSKTTEEEVLVFIKLLLLFELGERSVYSPHFGSSAAPRRAAAPVAVAAAVSGSTFQPAAYYLGAACLW